jgi:hypothetical protein
MEISLAQTQCKGEAYTRARNAANSGASFAKPLIGSDFSNRLNGAVENAIIILAGAQPDTGAKANQRWR